MYLLVAHRLGFGEALRTVKAVPLPLGLALCLCLVGPLLSLLVHVCLRSVAHQSQL